MSSLAWTLSSESRLDRRSIPIRMLTRLTMLSECRKDDFLSWRRAKIKYVNMTIGEAHEVWVKKMKGLQVPQKEILEARKVYEKILDEWRNLDDMARETIGDQEMLKVFNDNPKVKEAADKIISQYEKARELASDLISMYEKELGDL